MNKVIVIVGPTGVGKTKLSIELSKRMGGEVINADSTQFYKGLDIATAKIKPSEMDGIKHHLIDIKDISDNYTVFDYQKDARNIIDNLLSNSIIPIVVGGTGLYIKALLYDYKFNVEDNNQAYENLSNEELYAKLKEVDSNINIHINNRKRIVRALNYFNNNKVPFSDKPKDDIILYDALIIGLTTDRTLLYDNINKRVDAMLSNGLIDEAKRLYNIKPHTKAILTPIGYKELFRYFDKEISLEDAINDIKKGSRKYAKRQYTWFNNQMNVKWFISDFNNFDNTINDVIKYIKKES
jgi:tRNA dimethylallyltransferase